MPDGEWVSAGPVHSPSSERRGCASLALCESTTSMERLRKRQGMLLFTSRAHLLVRDCGWTPGSYEQWVSELSPHDGSLFTALATLITVRVDPDVFGMQVRVRTGADPDRRGSQSAAVLKHEHKHRRHRVRLHY